MVGSFVSAHLVLYPLKNENRQTQQHLVAKVVAICRNGLSWLSGNLSKLGISLCYILPPCVMSLNGMGHRRFTLESYSRTRFELARGKKKSCLGNVLRWLVEAGGNHSQVGISACYMLRWFAIYINGIGATTLNNIFELSDWEKKSTKIPIFRSATYCDGFPKFNRLIPKIPTVRLANARITDIEKSDYATSWVWETWHQLSRFQVFSGSEI